MIFDIYYFGASCFWVIPLTLMGAMICEAVNRTLLSHSESTERDYGAILLLDERYSHAYYRRFLSHWLNENMILLKNKANALEEAVNQFFSHRKQLNAHNKKRR